MYFEKLSDEALDGMSHEDAFDYHTAAIKEAFGLPLACQRERLKEKRKFSAELRIHRFEGASVGFLASEDYSAKMDVNARPRETMSFVFLEAGATAIGQDGRFTVLKPGRLFFFNTARAADFHFFTPFRQHVLHVPKSALEALFPSLERTTATAMRCDGNFLLLRNLVRATAADNALEAASIPALESLRDTFVSLAAMGLSEIFRTRLSDSPSQAALKLAAERVMTKSMGDASLTAQAIAAQCGISVRKLYQLFESEGGVMEALWRIRLESARAMLLSPWCKAMSAAEIGFACGFKTQAHFGSRFRRAYGISPAAYRSQGVREATA